MTATRWWAFDEFGDTKLEFSQCDDIQKMKGPTVREFPALGMQWNSFCQERTDRIYSVDDIKDKCKKQTAKKKY